MKGFLQIEGQEAYEGEWGTAVHNLPICAEIAFYTKMTGYEQALTDGKYKDKIVVFTYPQIGNYGIYDKDFEQNRPSVAGVVVYEIWEKPFHYQSQCSLQHYLQSWGIPLLTHIDTRAVMKKAREKEMISAILTVRDGSYSEGKIDSLFHSGTNIHSVNFKNRGSALTYA